MCQRDNLKVLYQEDKDCDKKKPYAGAEKREHARIDDLPLSKENRTLLREIINRTPQGCGDNCAIPKKLLPHLGHVEGIISEAGDESIERGLNVLTDLWKRLKAVFATWDMVKNKILITVVLGALYAAYELFMHLKVGG